MGRPFVRKTIVYKSYGSCIIYLILNLIGKFILSRVQLINDNITVLVKLLENEPCDKRLTYYTKKEMRDEVTMKFCPIYPTMQ